MQCFKKKTWEREKWGVTKEEGKKWTRHESDTCTKKTDPTTGKKTTARFLLLSLARTHVLPPKEPMVIVVVPSQLAQQNSFSLQSTLKGYGKGTSWKQPPFFLTYTHNNLHDSTQLATMNRKLVTWDHTSVSMNPCYLTKVSHSDTNFKDPMRSSHPA